MTTRKKVAGATLKNTYSQSPRIFEDIQRILREHRARRVTLDYDTSGHVAALSFALEVGERLLHFRLPARYENVERIFQQKKGRRLTDQEREQAYRTSWANIRDWLSAQMALIDTDMVEVAEIFLPYMVDSSGTTYFEALKERHFLLEAPRPGTIQVQEIQ